MVDGLPFHPDDDGALKRVAGWMTGKAMREVGTMMTGGSSSIKDLWLPMREAGASARAMLVGAAAAQWNVPVAECRAEAGKVLHASGRAGQLRRTGGAGGEAAAAGKGFAQGSPSTSSSSASRSRRIEAASKLDGTARFGIDVRPEGPALCQRDHVSDAGRHGGALRRDSCFQVAGHRQGVRCRPAQRRQRRRRGDRRHDLAGDACAQGDQCRVEP